MNARVSRRCFTLLLCMCLFVNTACAQSPERQAAAMDSILSTVAARDNLCGQVLVAEKGIIVYQKAFGYADYASRRPMTLSSMFDLASVSKQFTAMAVMMLKERGMLKYDDDVRTYVPELPYKGITIRHLLHHTSGLPRYEPFLEQKWDKTKIAVNHDIWKLLAEYQPPVSFRPGERWEYSNTGYALLATIIERVSGMSYSAFLSRNIFEKLEMKRTRVINRRLNPETLDDYAYGYVYSLPDGGYVLPDSAARTRYVVYLDGIVGDGTVNSTVGDLFLWDRALTTEKLVSKASLEEAFTPGVINEGTTTDYGFGWSLRPYEGRKSQSHTGGWPGYYTCINRFPENDRTIIVLCVTEPLIRIWQPLYAILDRGTAPVPRGQAAIMLQRELLNKDIGVLKARIAALIRESADYEFNEGRINMLGYDLLGCKRVEEAIELFKLNVHMFPKSANTYDSLGEAYAIQGDTKLAIENYEKALAIDPNLQSSKDALAKLKTK